MSRRIITFLSIFLISTLAIGQNLQSPSEFLGYEHGSYFTRHHQVMDYFDQLAANSGGTAIVKDYGRTDENRRLVTTFISTKENIANLDELMRAHNAGEDEKVAIVWLSYNVHGNESSGTEASMRTAHELITQHQDWLKNILVIIDPCLNPDGRDRYVNWYNQYKNEDFDASTISAEHDEPWPSGRFNHYLFDLNRDWAWLTQQETRQRLAVYNQWLPHIHADFHEMGHNDPYYFAPAVAPYHEVITDWQRSYQKDLGRNHAKYFDKFGWRYFTNEIFDLLYPGFGDTYPIFNGAVGMTYEQGGSGRAGVGVKTNNGTTLKLNDRIEHHHTVGISTVEFAFENYTQLISEYQTFATDKDFKYATYALWGNQEKMNALTDLLDLHAIQYTFGDGKKVSGFDYAKGGNGSVTAGSEHLLISTQQRKGTLVNVLFEPETMLEDSLTYDITAWSLAYAYGLNCIASESNIEGVKGAFSEPEQPSIPRDVYAYLIDWKSMSGAKSLSALLNEGVEVRFASESFTVADKEYSPGTLIVIVGDNTDYDLRQLIPSICKEAKSTFTTSLTGMVDSGKDFGSGSVSRIANVRVGLLTKQGSPERTGEVWHFFERELDYPLTLINADNFSESKLEELDVLILPSGRFNVDDEVMSSWIRKGGKLIAIGNALYNFSDDSEFGLASKSDHEQEDEEDYSNAHIPYDQQDREYIKKNVLGAIYKCKIDASHPLAFGYTEGYFTLRDGGRAYDWLKDGANVVYLEDQAEAVSGFVGSAAKEDQFKSLVFGVESKGRGSIVYMVDNPIFRGFWENGKLLFVNAVFLVD
ncbi:MAG: hypothetical protein ACI865_001374 [Flavobacteriaceae bacterium]|jgi:hypothetical protein